MRQAARLRIAPAASLATLGLGGSSILRSWARRATHPGAAATVALVRSSSTHTRQIAAAARRSSRKSTAVLRAGLATTRSLTRAWTASPCSPIASRCASSMARCSRTAAARAGPSPRPWRTRLASPSKTQGVPVWGSPESTTCIMLARSSCSSERYCSARAAWAGASPPLCRRASTSTGTASLIPSRFRPDAVLAMCRSAPAASAAALSVPARTMPTRS
mmetsp:Transcript_5115/g.15136  ORF Transcript_5115/g.15136 Transcript_5115/m.15136 type:complete len:219 (-) Transcript_5115:1417-2073(-)